MKLQIRTALALIACTALTVGVFAQTDKPESATDALLKADAAWSDAAGKEDKTEFFASYINDATVMPPNGPIAEGNDAVKAVFNGIFGLPNVSVSWQATSAEISESGELGYTIGTYDLKFDGPDGTPIADQGKYVAVWKKNADGEWKVAVDIFNSNLPLPSGDEAE